MKKKSLSIWFRRSPGGPGIVRHRFTEPHFEAHTKAIGSLLLAWNDFHERLSTLFVNAMGRHQFARSFAVWHITRNDLGKRALLRAALENLPFSEIGTRSKLVEEIAWILDAANKLEGARDNSAHTPLRYGHTISLAELLIDPLLLDDSRRAVIANTSFGNKRALSLEKNQKNLLTEYRYARERILILRDYAIAIEHAWANPPVPWPDRPSLPERQPIRRSKEKAQRQKQK